ncbi:MAG: TldD/PmbA family protein [Candidatus Thorarchaeota archaeon]|jgi:predicted Zn-dependent protease
MEFKKDLLLDRAQFMLKEAEKLGASQSEVTVYRRDSALTRLANSIIDQNVAERHAIAMIWLYFGKKRGSVSVEVFDDASLSRAVSMAAKVAKVSPEDTDFESLPTPKPFSEAISHSDLVSKGTLDATPEELADLSMLAVKSAHDTDKRINAVAGAISTRIGEFLVMNSLGIEGYQPETSCEVTLTVMADDGKEETAGWSKDSRKDLKDIRVREVSEKAATKAADGFGMNDLDPGEYEVIMEPAAVGGLLWYMAYIGFNAKMYQEYVSFLRDRIGEKVFSEKLNLWDDPLDKRHNEPSIFDSEGVPSRRLDLVEKGVVKNLTYDTLTATKDGVESTGHNRKWRGRSIPMAVHLIAQDGDSSLDEMIAETKNGILVTHFHYMNVVNPTEGVYTALTRDGTWKITDGEIEAPLKTIRFTDAAPRFLSNIDLIGPYSELRDTESIVPSMKLPSFKISGSQTE